MQHVGTVPDHPDLQVPGLTNGIAHWNLKPEALAGLSVADGQATVTPSGAIAVDTGQVIGRAPRDRCIVRDSTSAKDVLWGDINIPFDPLRCDKLLGEVGSCLNGRESFV